ncbi:hypothetical protein ACTOB_004569 [Actinoplanes oblitus]|uniref:Uncharacterized protein n=1 Tax=Actinoplanes oblitus TaxID=3040509 RepID=A0ABY8W537_9ACTN|nr:hypothetical protein [Actinoplanes oblitus]WIM92617.1 hypothetical protein ACTOB_004569 [Actinoplanes oblitus]
MRRSPNRAAARSLALCGVWIAVLAVALTPFADWPFARQWLADVLVTGACFYGWRRLDPRPRLPTRPLLVLCLIAFAGSVLVAVAGLRGLAAAGAMSGIVMITFFGGAWWLLRRPG